MGDIHSKEDLNAFEDEIEEESNINGQGEINIKIIENEKDLLFE